MEKNTLIMKTYNPHFNESTSVKKVNSWIQSISPVHLVKNYKLKKAIPLLKTTDFKVSQIAYIVGMETQELNDSFFNKYGITPLQFRQKHLSDSEV